MVQDEVCENNNLVGLIGMLKRCDEHLVRRVLERLCLILDTASGDDYLWFVSSNSGALEKVAEVFS